MDEVRKTYHIGVIQDNQTNAKRASLKVPVEPEQKSVWDLSDMKEIEKKIAETFNAVKNLCENYSIKAKYFMNNEAEWKLEEVDFFKDFDRLYVESKTIYQSLRKNMSYVFINIMNGVNLGFNSDGFSTKQPKGRRKSTVLKQDDFRDKYFKKSEALEDVQEMIENIKLLDTKEDLIIDTSSVYHLEKLGEDRIVITGSWGFVTQFDLKLNKLTPQIHDELADSGNG